VDRVILSYQASMVIEALKAMIKAEKRCGCSFNNSPVKRGQAPLHEDRSTEQTQV